MMKSMYAFSLLVRVNGIRILLLLTKKATGKLQALHFTSMIIFECIKLYNVITKQNSQTVDTCLRYQSVNQGISEAYLSELDQTGMSDRKTGK